MGRHLLDKQGNELNWKKGEDYPEWGDNEEYIRTITNGYLLKGETPRKAYKRVCKTIARRIGKPNMASKFFDYIWRGWLCLASPVLANTGTERGLPISCFGLNVADNMYDIGAKNLEMMTLAKHGGGVGVCYSNLRPKGSPIKDNGTSDGVVPFCKIVDSSILATNQGGVRKGAASITLDIEHGDFYEFINIRDPQGDINRQCHNLHICVAVSDEFMKKVEVGDEEARKRWGLVLRKRKKTGEPFILFTGNVQKADPKGYLDRGLKVTNTNICTEITLFNDEFHSFVCCLASLNLARYEEWKDSTLVEDTIEFLDGVLEEFIQRAKYIRGMENAVRSAEKGRALGLGVLGWHTLLQQKGLPFESLQARLLTRSIFSFIKEAAVSTSQKLARKHGEPEWCRGTGMRHTHLLAIAPTVSNSKLAGGVSRGIEPIASNRYVENGAQGAIIRMNKLLEKALESIGMNTMEVNRKILEDRGSIANLDFLDDYLMVDGVLVKKEEVQDTHLYYSPKEVFKTFREIDQLAVVKQAAVRQEYICQSQSLNLAFYQDESPRYINEVHMLAWSLGVKSLYYFKGESSLRGDIHRSTDSCTWCE